MKMATYLDFNASTPVDNKVLEAMIEVYRNSYGNADSRTHNFGVQSKKIIENARQQIAELLQVNSTEVFFNSGATESNNIAILGLREYADKIGKKHIITTSIEHKSVLEPLKHLETAGFQVTYISPDCTGRINPENIIESIRDNTLLVSVMHTNNETGVIQPIREIGEFLAEKDIFFHIDAAQSFGKLVNELRTVKYDFLSASAHKMYGPQGIGVLILKKKHFRLPPISPIMFGGHQEHGLRAGTLPTALISGFGKATELALHNHENYLQQYKKNKSEFLKMLANSDLKYKINGDQEHCIPTTLNISFYGVNSEALMLASKQFCGISNGSACNSGSYTLSHVLSSMGYDKARIQSAIRFSWGYEPINFEDILGLLTAVRTLQ